MLVCLIMIHKVPEPLVLQYEPKLHKVGKILFPNNIDQRSDSDDIFEFSQINVPLGFLSSTTPRYWNIFKASRIEDRPTPNISANSYSFGTFSFGFRRPVAIICFSCSITWNTTVFCFTGFTLSIYSSLCFLL